MKKPYILLFKASKSYLIIELEDESQFLQIKTIGLNNNK